MHKYHCLTGCRKQLRKEISCGFKRRTDISDPPPSRRRGTAIPLAVLAVIVLLVMGIGLLSLGMNGRISSIRNAQHIQARSAADSGLTKALFELNQKVKTNPADIDASMKQTQSPSSFAWLGTVNEALPHCEATFSYNATSAGVFAALGTQGLTIESVGTCGAVTAKVYALAGLKGLFDSAILVRDRISLMPNTLVKGYNSADPSDTDFKLQIGTTSTLTDRIPLGPGTVVDGDVFVGVGGDPKSVIGAGGTITGSKYALDRELDFPAITAPPLPAVGTALSASGATITLGPAGSGTYSEISLSQGGGLPGVLEITGGDVVLHVTGNINLGNGCELIVRPGSSLTLYVDGNIAADNSVGFNNQAGNVRDFQLCATGSSEQVFNLKAKSSIFGTIYAPNVDITLYPSAEMRGAIVGRNVTFKSGSVFYYDEALRDNVSARDVGAYFTIRRWREE
jgi:Tfp pilus assembly protein PilX